VPFPSGPVEHWAGWDRTEGNSGPVPGARQGLICEAKGVCWGTRYGGGLPLQQPAPDGIGYQALRPTPDNGRKLGPVLGNEARVIVES
jgi:hypothetical protein